MCTSLVKSITKDYDVYLKDESRKTGNAESISFPESEKDIINIIKSFGERKIRITIQGARTGLTGGAVPEEGHILSLEKMNAITGLRYDEDDDSFILHVQPGMLLADIRKAVCKKDLDTSGWSNQSLEALEKMKEQTGYFFPPDPTETTASIGGMVACNASGARSFFYGPTRNYIDGLHIILSDGSKIYVKRGLHKAYGYKFSLTADTGRVIQGRLPQYVMPEVKNASGYYVKQNMDLIDVFIGSEGTLGIISEIELKLLKKPEFTWGVVFFFQQEKDALQFVKTLREDSTDPDGTNIKPVAIEYFNSNALELLRRQKEKGNTFSSIPRINEAYNTAIYIEFDEILEEDMINSMIEAARRAGYCGGSEDDTWVAVTPQLMDRMKLFRHAVPEAVNLMVDQRRGKNPDITKLGTDMAVPDEKLQEIVNMYNVDLLQQKFESVMFGHIGNNHIHVNILPESMDEYVKAKQLYKKWAGKVLEAGGTVSAEHGIGKLKMEFLEMMYGQEGIREMAEVRAVFDPDNILNSGNLFRIRQKGLSY